MALLLFSSCLSMRRLMMNLPFPIPLTRALAPRVICFCHQVPELVVLDISTARYYWSEAYIFHIWDRTGLSGTGM